MERLFSKDDLLTIERDAADNFAEYWDIIVGTGSPTEKTIVTISKERKLVFVTGNDHTGWEHLRDRHAPYSYRNYWKENEQGAFRLDDPSKFHPQMIPIIDYVKISDGIFVEGNRNDAKNKGPDLFDLYIGSYEFLGQTDKYHLLTYKGTNIVHTLFPDKGKFNKRNKTKYAKGIVSTSIKFPEGYNDLTVPYLNSAGTAVFSILVRKFYREKLERLLIVRHDNEGGVKDYFLAGSRPFEEMEKFEHLDMEFFQHAKLSELERLVNEIDKNGKIESIYAPVLQKADLEGPPGTDQFEVHFELNQLLGKALVEERLMDDELQFLVENIAFYKKGDELDEVASVLEKELIIFPMFIVNTNETIWADVKTGMESELTSAIGRRIMDQMTLERE